MLKANTPYMVQMAEGSTELGIRGAVKLVSNEYEHVLRLGDWEIVGMYHYKKWKADDEELQSGRAIYGFVGTAVEGLTIGRFVRGAAGAYINPMRAYMRYNPELKKSQNAAQFVSRYALADWTSGTTTSELPETISVVRERSDENNNEHTTVIGHVGARKKDFKANLFDCSVFDLKGRSVNKDERMVRGAYYGKKIVK